ncbi:hypothetical protein [Janthinobacterium lividum]|uniref:hypothetical protein n=1 Tax=Janthinobacterium lividum TaxID=29581 RepID=UPI00140C6674|nr:hypothetical protein [Janthinobacterium lividum]NHQ92747.1 hypothetical protein [Janthinobacterium lividum]
MAFRYVELSGEEARKLFPRTVGYVLSFSRCFAVDDDNGAVLACLGGKGSLEPERGEPPTYYNLRWDGHIYAACAHDKVVKDEDGYLTIFDLNLGIPAPLWHKEEELLQLWRDAMQVLYSGMCQRDSRVRVNFVGRAGKTLSLQIPRQ